jgi:PAS domain S-box-containing protein
MPNQVSRDADEPDPALGPLPTRGDSPGKPADAQTERLLLESRTQELAVSASLLRAIVETSPDAMVALDLSGRLVVSNRRYERLWQIPRDLIDRRDAPGIFEHILSMVAEPQRLLERVDAVRSDSREQYDLFALKDGRVFERRVSPYGAEGVTLGVVIYWRDVTERWREGHIDRLLQGPALQQLGTSDARRFLLSVIEDQKQSTLALRASEERFRTVVESAPDAILVATRGAITYANAAAARTFGVESAVELLGRQMTDAFDASSRERVAQYLLAVEERAQNMPTEQERLLRADGWILDVEVSAVPFATGGHCAALFFLRDITRRLEAENQLRTFAADLEQRVSDRTVELEAANRELIAFCHSVSHDLRAPLRGISGWTRALLEDCSDALDSNGRQYVTRVANDAARMWELIDDLLKLSRVSQAELHMERVELSDLAQEIVQRLRTSTPDRDVRVSVQPGLSVTGDVGLLRILLENLLANSWKFTGGRPEAEIEVLADGTADDRVYVVRDNGVGFDMRFASKLFAPFQRMHSVAEFPGTGVGLATVQRVVTRHGGRVWAEAAVNVGTTIRFTLGTAQPDG